MHGQLNVQKKILDTKTHSRLNQTESVVILIIITCVHVRAHSLMSSTSHSLAITQTISYLVIYKIIQLLTFHLGIWSDLNADLTLLIFNVHFNIFWTPIIFERHITLHRTMFTPNYLLVQDNSIEHRIEGAVQMQILYSVSVICVDKLQGSVPHIKNNRKILYFVLDCVGNVMAHAQKPHFVFRRNRQVHLNQRGRQFSRLLAAELCASAVVMPDTPRSEVVWRVLATHCIRQFPLHFPSRASPCAITFQLDSNICLPALWFWGAAPQS